MRFNVNTNATSLKVIPNCSLAEHSAWLICDRNFSGFFSFRLWLTISSGFFFSCLPLRPPFCPYMVAFKNRAHSIYGVSVREERVLKETVTFDEEVLLICGKQMISLARFSNLTRHDKSSTPVLNPRC